MSKNISMSINQFMEVRRGEKSFKDIEIENGMESLATKIINDDRLRRMTVFVIAGLNYASVVAADTSQAVAKIDNAGFMFLGIFQTVGKWLCLLGCIIEILKGIMNGSSKDVGRIMLKYLLIFATLYLMPFGFELIKEIFG